MMAHETHYDAVIVGGGHNGLVAAAYLARAGKRVLVLERRSRLGGAAISERAFPGVDVRLSAYSYLLSLFPQKIINELALPIQTRQRRIAAFTPDQHGSGLLISNQAGQVSRDSFRQLTGSDQEYESFQRFYTQIAALSAQIWPTLLEPLPSRADLLARCQTPESQQAWDMIMERPLGEAIQSCFKNDLVRGTVFTDAKIGVLTHGHDQTLLQNRTFLYHVIGNGTGEWRVPVGGMGALTDALAQTALRAHAELICDADVQQVYLGPEQHEVVYQRKGREERVSATYVLINAVPTVLARLIGSPPPPRPNGAVFKINMVLKRLPRLTAGQIAPEEAFTGTFHVDEGYAAMERSYAQANEGQLPDIIPAEMYCHSLTDGSIVGESARGLTTLTLFGLDTPYSLFAAAADHEGFKRQVTARLLAGINRYTAEPIEECLALDSAGEPCLAAKSPIDLENELNMIGGNIFHTDLTWPFAERADQVGTWGVETDFPNVLLCGSGALRGGAVSGIPGHNAAMYVLSRQNNPK